MSKRNSLALVVLICLCVAMGKIAYTRTIGARFAAQPAALAEGFTTEEAWVVDEIVRDMTEMSALATRRSLDARIRAVEGRSHVFAVDVDGSRTTLDLDAALWSPPAFSPLAAALLSSGAAVTRPTSTPDVRTLLIDMTPDALVTASSRASDALQRDMRSVAAHDVAALTLAAFALRESADRLSDTRWALNRMTAHLAIADALSGDTDAGIDHRLASAVLLLFTGDQVAALQALDAVGDQSSAPGVAEWSRAIRLRANDDWRILTDPKRSSRIEQREYLRARRTTVSGSTGAATLESLQLAPDADLIRIISASSTGIADGWLSADAFEYERDEYERVYAGLHQREMDGPLADALNVPATRCVTQGRVQVLPWGAWAEFFQRHLAAAIAKQDTFLRWSLGAQDRADAQKTTLHREYGSLWSFPLATMFWTRGKAATEADSTYLADAIDVALASPHRVVSTVWAQIELGTKYEPVRRGVPRPVSWFLAPEPRSAYQATARLMHTGHSRGLRVLEQMRTSAPDDWGLAATYLTERYGKKVTLAAVEEVAGRRMEYDLRPLGWAQPLVANREEGIRIERRGCGISASWCLTLGEDLASLGRDNEALQAYEIAFADPELDAVTKSNKTAWLVRYYAAHGRLKAAVTLAEEGAQTASFTGLATAGRLYEQLGRLDDAEATFSEGARHYDQWGEVAGFYYRQTQVRKDRRFLSDWKTSVERLFPEGLSDDPPPSTRPALGVLVEKGSSNASYYNLRTGDVIVAVDGWRIANVAQYRGVRAFPVEGRIVLTVWRGTQNVEVTLPNRDFVPYFTVVDYPPKGWIE